MITQTTAGIVIDWHGGGMCIVPLLTRSEIERFGPTLQILGRACDGAENEWIAIGEDGAKFLCLVILTAMRRRYPDLTLADVDLGIHIADFSPLWKSLWMASQLAAAPQTEREN